jgi:hypothetical protein
MFQLRDTTYSYSLTGCQRFCVQSAVEASRSGSQCSADKPLSLHTIMSPLHRRTVGVTTPCSGSPRPA